ncbi:hypothetical protein, partial [Dyadobacter frigoris]|uniref:hypothetical protein n=1 Tax=Dyadobacter frigoris TaxID=2576211 RepID=UPI002557A530
MTDQKEIQSSGRLIVVAYRVPFKIIHQDEHIELRQNSGGLVSAVLSLTAERKDSFFSKQEKIQWIGYSEQTEQELGGLS